MVKDWTPERKVQLRKLQELLTTVEMVNRTTGAISDIQKCSELARELLYFNFDVEKESFWNFLIQELNKE
jgi:hypothetical protein